MLGPVVRVYSRRCDRARDTGRLLEFRGGTSARPILSPLPGDPVPIDGGTRVEVQLKDTPHESGGLLEIDSYFRRTISLDALVGSLAPNLNVSVVAKSGKGLRPVAEPGDWLRMRDIDFLRRLNPTLERQDADLEKAGSRLMQPITDSCGRVFGRAFIWPDRYSLSNESGWVTVSGLRAARLRNVRGLLLGEAVTASRDSAKPLATGAAMASWATKQAEMIGAAVKDEERQALSAEVVLECGGDPKDLKIVQWGAHWMSMREFEEKLSCSTELAISFDGDFDYDEDADDVHPRAFGEDFDMSDDVALVLKFDGSICRIGNNHWPRSMAGRNRMQYSNVADYVREAISRIWNDNDESEEQRIVGTVGGTEISRRLVVFHCVDDEGWM